MKLKTLLAAAVATIVGITSAATSTLTGWTDDFEAAKKQAVAENKLLLVDFSGSDWCGWCKRLDREVFAKPEFLEGAKQDFVLVMVDSPKNKKLLSEKAAEQNPKLKAKYRIHRWPTVLVMDADGSVLHETGYRAGGPEKYLNHLAEIKKFCTKLITLKRDIAGMSKGTPARLAKIDAVFADADEDTLKQNSALITELLDNDPDCKYAAKYPFVKYRMPLDKKLENVLALHRGRIWQRIEKNTDERPLREQDKQASSELADYAVEALNRLLRETSKEQASAPEYAKKEYESFTKKIKSLLKKYEQGK